MMVPPPPPAVGVVEGVVLPPQAESTRARDAAPAATVTQRARTVLPRIDPPQESKGCARSIGTDGPRHVRQGPKRYRMVSFGRSGGIAKPGQTGSWPLAAAPS